MSQNTIQATSQLLVSMPNSSADDTSADTPLIDNVASHPTPEGLLLTLMPAGLSPRLTAWLIDIAIRMGVMIVMSIVFAMFDATGAGLVAIGYFLINWLYPVFFEVYKDGMTPGKKNQGIYVCHDDGTPITLQASMIRNLLRVADFLPFGFVAGALSMMFNGQSQRIGDMVAGTLVVYREQDDIEKLYKSVYGMVAYTPDQAKMNNPQNQTLYDSASPLFFYPLKLNEQQALVSYLERIPFLSQARQVEIASNLAPLVKTSRLSTPAINEAVYYATLRRASMISGAQIGQSQAGEGDNIATAQSNTAQSNIQGTRL